MAKGDCGTMTIKVLSPDESDDCISFDIKCCGYDYYISEGFQYEDNGGKSSTWIVNAFNNHIKQMQVQEFNNLPEALQFVQDDGFSAKE